MTGGGGGKVIMTKYDRGGGGQRHYDKAFVIPVRSPIAARRRRKFGLEYVPNKSEKCFHITFLNEFMKSKNFRLRRFWLRISMVTNTSKNFRLRR